MSDPTGLDPVEPATMAAKFGVALDQLNRDYLISLVLWALQQHADDLIFFGGTALARTYLTDGRLSEDIDLMAIHDRHAVAVTIRVVLDPAITLEMEEADRLRKEAESTAALSATRRRHAALAMKAAGLTVRDIGTVLHVSHQRAHQLLNS